MTISSLASDAVSRWTVPMFLFGSVFGVFKLFESYVSPQFKTDLSSFILKARYEPYLGKLPTIVQHSFDAFMGKHQLSVKCLSRVILISLVTTVASVVFTLIYNHEALSSVVTGLPRALAQMHDKLASNQNTNNLAIALQQLTHPGALVLIIPPLWVMWCFVPNFISVLKVRIVMIVISASAPTLTSLLLILIIDILVTIFQFMISVVFFQVLVGYFWYCYVNGFIVDISVVSIVFGLIFTFEFVVFVLSGALIFSIPFANVFWATTLPSLWLWTYIISAITARLLASSKSAMRLMVYILNIEEKPISSLGIIAGSVACVGSYIFLVIVELAKRISGQA